MSANEGPGAAAADDSSDCGGGCGRAAGRLCAPTATRSRAPDGCRFVAQSTRFLRIFDNRVAAIFRRVVLAGLRGVVSAGISDWHQLCGLMRSNR